MKNKNAKWGVNIKKIICPDCGTQQPRIRMPKSLREALWGGTTCNNCGCKMDKFGQKIKEK